eukprot:357494-Chlamydomonas_euryale.AAC.10
MPRLVLPCSQPDAIGGPVALALTLTVAVELSFPPPRQPLPPPQPPHRRDAVQHVPLRTALPRRGASRAVRAAACADPLRARQRLRTWPPAWRARRRHLDQGEAGEGEGCVSTAGGGRGALAGGADAGWDSRGRVTSCAYD